MTTVTGLTKDAMQAIVDATITDANVVGDNLILTLHNGSTIDAGNVRGPTGDISGMSAITPDKAVWNLADGSDMVEVWGQVIPASFLTAFSDDLNTNTLASYTAIADGGTTWTGSSFVMSAATNGILVPPSSWGNAGDTDRCRARGKVNVSDAGAAFSAGFVKTGLAWSDCYLATIGGNGVVTLQMGSPFLGGDELSLGSIPGFTVGTYYWLDHLRVGDSYTVRVRDAADANTIVTFTDILPVGWRAGYGAGVSLRQCFMTRKSGAGAGELDFLEYDNQQQEQRNAYVAITAPNGTRTVKKLFGSLGPSSLVSDFSLSRMPRAMLWRNAASASVPNNTGIDVVWDSAESNADSMWNSGTNPERITCVKAGLHDIHAVIFWSTTGGTRETTINHYNSAGVLQRASIQDVSPGAGNAGVATGKFGMAVGDYIKINAWQSSGAASTFGTTDKRTFISVVRISD